MTRKPLAEGSIIGILGGGQLGAMTAIAATKLGYCTHIFAPEGDAPACRIADKTTRKAYDDEDALKAFGGSVDTITSEFENVPAATMELLSRHAPVSPGVKALSCAQHRISEKNLARKLGIATPDFAAIKTAEDVSKAMRQMKNGAVLKTCRLGYDGKGQVRINAGEDGIDAFKSLASDDCILEELVDFTAEVSFLIARNASGNIAAYPASINHHIDGILATSRAPAPANLLSHALLKDGQNAARALAYTLELVGVLAVEMFITDHGLVFNEIAPRPHNSFHWTIEGAETSQFAQLVRAITGLPFGGVATVGQWQMENILGQDMEKLDAAINEQGAFIHRYGKAEAKHNRKMAHITRKISHNL